jgi:hypothetical protein
MVSFLFKHNMYSGVYSDLNPKETPINLFERDQRELRKYQLLKYRDVYDTKLEQGDCLFIPSNFWYQSETVAKEG